MSDRKLVAFARNFRKGILGDLPSTDMCFAVCAPLRALLSLAGVDTVLVEVWFQSEPQRWPMRNHFWLKLQDGRILDPTADQFGLDPIYLGEIPESYRAQMHFGERR